MCAHRTPPPGPVRGGPGRAPRPRRWWERAVRPQLPARGSRSLRGVIACVPALAAVAGLVVCAAVDDRRPVDVGRSEEIRARAPAGHRAARPPIVPRQRWLGDASVGRRSPTRYAGRVSAVFVHHTDSPNAYDCADAPRIIQYLYVGQAGVRNWDDIGYNFLVDRCGTIYEGRAGGPGRPVVGAHTQGFNVGTTGIAALGTFTAGVPVPRAMTDAIAAVAAWKLGLAGIDPRAPVRLVSTNGLSKYPAGTRGTFKAVSGHTDGYWTACPGAALVARLPAIRQQAARLQGRR